MGVTAEPTSCGTGERHRSCFAEKTGVVEDDAPGVENEANVLRADLLQRRLAANEVEDGALQKKKWNIDVRWGPNGGDGPDGPDGPTTDADEGDGGDGPDGSDGPYGGGWSAIQKLEDGTADSLVNEWDWTAADLKQAKHEADFCLHPIVLDSNKKPKDTTGMGYSITAMIILRDRLKIVLGALIDNYNKPEILEVMKKWFPQEMEPSEVVAKLRVMREKIDETKTVWNTNPEACSQQWVYSEATPVMPGDGKVAYQAGPHTVICPLLCRMAAEAIISSIDQMNAGKLARWPPPRNYGDSIILRFFAHEVAHYSGMGHEPGGAYSIQYFVADAWPFIQDPWVVKWHR